MKFKWMQELLDNLNKMKSEYHFTLKCELVTLLEYIEELEERVRRSETKDL